MDSGAALRRIFRTQWLLAGLALVLIAVCTGLKIYPAILGMLYIQEKRYAEAARLA